MLCLASSTEDGNAILQGHPWSAVLCLPTFLSYFKIPSISPVGPVPGFKPATSFTELKRSTLASPDKSG